MLTTQPLSEGDVLIYLRGLFSQCMNVEQAQLDDDEPFFSLGLTSLIHQEIVNALTRTFGPLSSTVLFEFPNFRLLSQHLAQAAQKSSDKASAQDSVSAQ